MNDAHRCAVSNHPTTQVMGAPAPRSFDMCALWHMMVHYGFVRRRSYNQYTTVPTDNAIA